MVAWHRLGGVVVGAVMRQTSVYRASVDLSRGSGEGARGKGSTKCPGSLTNCSCRVKAWQQRRPPVTAAKAVNVELGGLELKLRGSLGLCFAPVSIRIAIENEVRK